MCLPQITLMNSIMMSKKIANACLFPSTSSGFAY